MTLCLRWGIDDVNGTVEAKSGFIFFDAVTSYTQSYKGQVTKHPIALGGNITDHFIRENPRFTLSAVISGVDISTGTYLIEDLAGNSPYNVYEAPNPVSVKSTDDSILNKFLPDSIGQFLPETTPEVIVDEGREQYLELIKEAIIDLMSGVVFNDFTGMYDPNIQLVELYEYEGSLIRKISNNLVITDMTFKEDVQSGEGLYVDLSLERVTFAFLKKTVVPKDVVDSLKKKTAAKSDKGKVDSTAKSSGDDAPEDVDPLREARNNG